MELQEFVQTTYDSQTWSNLLSSSGLGIKSNVADTPYTDKEVEILLTAASKTTGRSREELLEAYGRFLSARLIKGGSAQIDQSACKTLDFIENAQGSILDLMTKQVKSADVPDVQIKRVNTDKLVIHYESTQNMISVALGIVHAVADYYHESDELDVHVTRASKGYRSKIAVKHL